MKRETKCEAANERRMLRLLNPEKKILLTFLWREMLSISTWRALARATNSLLSLSLPHFLLRSLCPFPDARSSLCSLLCMRTRKRQTIRFVCPLINLIKSGARLLSREARDSPRIKQVPEHPVYKMRVYTHYIYISHQNFLVISYGIA